MKCTDSFPNFEVIPRTNKQTDRQTDRETDTGQDIIVVKLWRWYTKDAFT